jgi:hypothetical protein
MICIVAANPEVTDITWKKDVSFFLSASSGNTVVVCSPRNPKVAGSNPAGGSKVAIFFVFSVFLLFCPGT